MSLKSSAALLVYLFVLTSCASAPLETVHWRSYTFQEVRSLSSLPTNLQNALGVGRPGLDGIADRSGRFNATDVVDEGLPMRRFITAGVGNNTALIAIERGGIALFKEVLLFEDVERHPVVKQKWSLFKRPNTLGDVIKLIEVQE